MPKNNSIKKVLVIGSGPIVIGQAAEFDYSGTQCVTALKEEGIEVVLVNSNPATIMTDVGFADKTYIEPLTIPFIEKIIIEEKPDSIIAGMGGQTGLNLACELYDSGILKKYGVNVIGTTIESIKEGEDRDSFKKLMERTNQPVIESEIVNDIDSGIDFANKIGYPVIVRPAYTLGGTGGGIADNEEELKKILISGLHLSRVGQVLIEKSIKGWREIEFEVVRDSYGNCITICSMENVDPVGVHTGDSIVVAPAQTLTDREYQMLRTAAIDIIDSVKIEGGCNVQFALSTNSYDYAVIEINPRVSRSSALASKATGYPIAKVAAKIALGYGLDEIKNQVTGKTFACFEPALDYVVVKIPRWPFDKFSSSVRTLGTKMMATGEIMAIGNSFEQAFLKGIRSLEIGQYSLEKKSSSLKTMEELKKSVVRADDERIFDLAEMLRRNYLLETVCQITGMDPFFINKIKNIILMEEELKLKTIEDITEDELRLYKEKGFSDKGMADFMKCSPEDVDKKRKKFGITPVYKMVDTCAGEFDAISPYYYSTYDKVDEVIESDNDKVLVIGSGPIRIGQGIEFDYCSVHSILALKKMGYETIIINNNPETVSTDFDIADKLYFEPLTEENVLDIIEKEQPKGVILQFGGQTAIKLANFLSSKNIPILGTGAKEIDEAEDREKFEKILEKYNINRPKGIGVWSVNEGVKVANSLSYPVLVRPSYVLGGQGMEITYNEESLKIYLEDAFYKDKKNPVLIDRYLQGREIEVDAICDGVDVFIPGIMEHLESAGVHSGDSISMYPPVNISNEMKNKIQEVTEKITLGLKVIGMINIQFIEYENELYIIEVNPRSSRTVPYISKVTGVSIIEVATKVMLGKSLKEQGYHSVINPNPSFYTVKFPIFSTEKLPLVEVSLGPEMRSTGEVLGIGYTINEALYKGFVSAKMNIPKKNSTILVTISSHEHERFLPIAKRLNNMGCRFLATEGTKKFLDKNGINAIHIHKLKEGVPNVQDVARSGQADLIIDIPGKKSKVEKSKHSDGFKLRRVAAEANVNLITSLDTANALIDVMENQIKLENLEIKPVGKY